MDLVLCKGAKLVA